MSQAAQHSAGRTLQTEDAVLKLKGGRTLRVLQAGDGATVVLIHGVLGMAEDMASGLFEALAPSYRVIAVDRPGHGGSRRQRFEASPARQAELIREGLQQLGLGDVLLVGHSIGGAVALAYARAWPGEVRGLVLLGPAAYPELRPIEHTYLSPRATPWFGPLVSQAAHDTVDPSVLPLLQKAMFAPQEIPAYWAGAFPHPQVLRPEQMTANGEDISDMPALAALAVSYRTIKTPTVILTGDKDGIVNPSRHARALAVALPNARLEMLPGLGHMIHHFAQDRIEAAVNELTAAKASAA